MIGNPVNGFASRRLKTPSPNPLPEGRGLGCGPFCDGCSSVPSPRRGEGQGEGGLRNLSIGFGMTARFIAVLALFAVLGASGPAGAADKRYPDWPCQQLKVPELSVAAIWPDFVPAKAADLAAFPGLGDLVAKLAARRTPMEEAKKQIGKFVAGTPAEKQAKAHALFTGLFDALNSQRFQVMNGLERAYRRQKDFAAKIRDDAAKLREVQDQGGDEAHLQELVRQVQWETRIFDERRKTITYACEVPVQIDQRLFALARALQDAAGMS